MESRVEEKYSGGKITIDENVRKRYLSAAYGIAGNHSGVQICGWTKKVLRGGGVCYKQKFYGVECHRCCQMSPALAWCQENCVFCWRPMEWMRKTEMGEEEVDSPEEIIEKTVSARKKVLSGIGGAEDCKRELFEESFSKFPSHWAISLSGEPTIYPRIGELVKALRGRREVKSIFIVTNGQEPDVIEKMSKENSLPTQLYVSLSAPNEELFTKINRPVYADGWGRLKRTLGMLGSLRCRSVIRLTLIRGLNDDKKHFSSWAALIEMARPDFIEVKSYMFLGMSRQRLEEGNTAPHEFVKEWTLLLEERLPSYSMISEDPVSKVVLLKRRDSTVNNIIGRA
ncbi:MAG: 4-demethylwyosine synthase TYW1 [Candidatus Micrarchaeota archaeon]